MHNEEKYQRATTLVVVEGNRPTLDKGKMKISDNANAKKSYNFKGNPLVFKETLEIEVRDGSTTEGLLKGRGRKGIAGVEETSKGRIRAT